MRDTTLKTLLLGLLLASLLGLTACNGGGDEAVASSSGQDSALAGSDDAAADGSAAATGENAKGELPVVLAQGQEIDITQHLDRGRITIVDFYSEYCGPCRRIAPYLLKLHQDREDITVVKVDINRPDVRGIDWTSPVARQYKLRSIPHFQVYDPEGRLLAEGREAMGLIQGYLDGKS